MEAGPSLKFASCWGGWDERSCPKSFGRYDDSLRVRRWHENGGHRYRIPPVATYGLFRYHLR